MSLRREKAGTCSAFTFITHTSRSSFSPFRAQVFPRNSSGTLASSVGVYIRYFQRPLVFCLLVSIHACAHVTRGASAKKSASFLRRKRQRFVSHGALFFSPRYVGLCSPVTTENALFFFGFLAFYSYYRVFAHNSHGS